MWALRLRQIKLFKSAQRASHYLHALAEEGKVGDTSGEEVWKGSYPTDARIPFSDLVERCEY